jgi:hypothetical protein
LTQIRLRLELATRRTRRALEERRRALRAASEARREARDVYLRLRWREDLLRERRAFEGFYEQYDALVGLLCLAAQEGVTPGAEEEYRTLRAWFCARYPAIKPALSAHLQSDPNDALLPGPWGRRACDGFEALFLPPTLDAMFAADGGNLIGRLMRTQAAVTGWQESIARRESACNR